MICAATAESHEPEVFTQTLWNYINHKYALYTLLYVHEGGNLNERPSPHSLIISLLIATYLMFCFMCE